ARHHPPVFPDDIVSPLNGALDSFLSRIDQVDIDFADLLHDAKAARRSIEQTHECLRENVLARMLLDVVEPARPIDSAFDGGADLRRWSLDEMKDKIAFVSAFHYASAIEHPGVAGLPAASWIEGGPVQRHCGPATDALRDVNHARLELDQVRVSVIETFGCRHFD